MKIKTECDFCGKESWPVGFIRTVFHDPVRTYANSKMRLQAIHRKIACKKCFAVEKGKIKW